MSKRKVISQREARRTKKALFDLQARVDAQHSSWSHQYPGGVLLGCFEDDKIREWVRIARKCGRAVVLIEMQDAKIQVFACPHRA